MMHVNQTQMDEQKLAVFERKVLRKIYRLVKDSDGTYRQRMNYELDALIGHETIVRTCNGPICFLALSSSIQLFA
ncbi:unnamed protein product, partial [Iphiclides podalirius]